MSDPDDLARELSPVLERLTRLVRLLATAGGLSLPAAALLHRLMTDGPQRLTALAAAERVSQPGMTQLVTRLEREGLVLRRPSPDDGRVVLVEATPAGSVLFQRRRDERRDALRHLLEQLSPDDRAALDRAAPALARLVDAEHPGPGVPTAAHPTTGEAHS